MFTGIVSETGEILRAEDREGGRRLRIRACATAPELGVGGSVSVSGCCLSAETVEADAFTAFCTPETLRRTTLGVLGAGDRVNLELPLRPTDRLGGHFVQGHVDGVGEIAEVRDLDGSWLFRFDAPDELARYLVEKGSVAVEGISLTVAGLEGRRFDVAVIPETWRRTNLGLLGAGSPVNLEIDILAKYVERLIEGEASDGQASFAEAYRRFSGGEEDR